MAYPVEINARSFGPGLPAGGAVATVAIGDATLAIHVTGRTPEIVPLKNVTLSMGGFNQAGWQFLCESQGASWTLWVDDAPTQQRLQLSPPPALAAQIGALVARRRRDRHQAALVWTLFLLAPVLVLGMLWWQSVRIASVVVDRVPVRAEVALGDLIFLDARRALRDIPEGGALLAVRAIGQRLTANSAYVYRWHVVIDPAINAYAVPGGIVVVNSGLLLAADSAEEVAGVLAHEVQHVERRHSLKAIVHDLGFYALLRFALGDYGAGIAGKLARNLGALKFSREQESDADLHALQALQKAGIDGAGMLSFFQKLGAREGKNIPLLSTHPASQDRLEALEAALRQAGRTSPPPLPHDWPRIKAQVAAVQKPH